MDLTVGFVSQNLVTQTNFIEFRDNQIFQEFQSDGCLVKPKNEILGNNLGKVHLKSFEHEPK